MTAKDTSGILSKLQQTFLPANLEFMPHAVVYRWFAYDAGYPPPFFVLS